MALSDRIAAYVQAEVARTLGKGMATLAVGTVVTSPSQGTNLPLTVIFDGSALAVTVKQTRGLVMVASARVVLGKFGSDWVILGGLTNPATGTGTSRIVIGADVPAELKAYGIDTAMLSYLTDKTTGQECGYFFIGSSNRFDGGANDNRVQAFGNVVYPTLGNPASATMSDVKTNFQQNMRLPYPQTVFKDQEVLFWTNAKLDIGNGATKFDVQGSSKLIARIDNNDIQAGDPSSATAVETMHAVSFVNGWSGTCKYQYVASPPKGLQFMANLSAGTKTDGTTILTLPVGWRPTTSQDMVGSAFGGTNPTNQLPHLNFAPTGIVSCQGMNTHTNINLSGVISLNFA